MGALCCCARTDDSEEYGYPGNSMYRNCICLRFFFHQLSTGYRGIFHRLEGRPVTAQIQGATLSSSAISSLPADNSMNDSHGSISRPLPYDSDPRYSRLQRDGLVSRREKAMSHFQEDTQPMRRNLSSSGIEALGLGRRRNGVDSEEDCKFSLLETSEKALTTKSADGLIYVQPSSEDEDLCPTCLEEYTPENPKITMRCSHHFHLGCIYEWMERSESCPICGKEMEFCESP
ncbi:E3 ubiquitin-protein ligase At3g02290-like [Punica granatum]|uniref:E3 ubiquitin-protein ligase At3g02290-like n=2 Tax=Punica granatum TaxID=22663 RepID=A0A6P8E1B5_PUNGR|nr:E3 ubiquitin-protein ligase At3g02290-like [Punica granatum]XP_031400330.1 E3 ubiquitin-protein ligase At3g02290-like [Punica granatum]XP_031400331.1 E3 ubiquitin-protein ligase At3g02290-like [Punica granatum]PKI42815.1 hypothetical protein CRG98_036794 [Punica granatum]